MRRFFHVASSVIIVFFIVIAVIFAATLLPIDKNFKVMVVTSGSMEPTIRTGSLVIIKPEDSYKVGDIVTFKSTQKKDDFTTHRIHAIDNEDGTETLQTKGDANEEPDFEKIDLEKVVGRVIYDLPWIGYIVGFIKTLPGLIIIIIIPAMAIIYQEIDKIKGEVKNFKIKKNKKKDKRNDEE